MSSIVRFQPLHVPRGGFQREMFAHRREKVTVQFYNLRCQIYSSGVLISIVFKFVFLIPTQRSGFLDLTEIDGLVDSFVD